MQVLSGSTSEHTYGVLLKQLESLGIPNWIDVITETRILGRFGEVLLILDLDLKVLSLEYLNICMGWDCVRVMYL